MIPASICGEKHSRPSGQKDNKTNQKTTAVIAVVFVCPGKQTL